jgi:mRNA interferase MazF
MTESITVAFISSYEIELPLFRIPLPATVETGLLSDSHIMVDKVMTLRRSQLGARIGNASTQTMTAVNRALATFLGIH